jgi:hypothetical protein
MKNKYYQEPVLNVIVAILAPWLLFIFAVGFLCCKHWGTDP